jgi:vacuolar-type H+-ATPase subunit C/Vma6
MMIFSVTIPQQEYQRLLEENTRLTAAVILARDTFSRYGDLHAAKPDEHKATANYKLAAQMDAALRITP